MDQLTFPIELESPGQFQDAVLETARQRADALLAEAKDNREQALNSARLSCRKADRGLIEAAYTRETERQYSAALQSSRQELLRARAQLVDGIFAEVEQNIVAFADGPGYAPWLAARLKKHLDAVGHDTPATLYLRAKDMEQAAGLQALVSTLQPKAAGDIRLGGFRLAVGRLLFDETLDSLLEEEKRRFVAESGLTVE